ncbi:MAG: L,D-transpeptidase [Akkermansia sp.]|nr:L,D-transpeptidase [Akkermansia sp.]
MIEVSVSQQTLRYAELCFACSTGRAGVGTEPGSGRTPTGLFEVCSMHGENAPLMTVFRGRLPVGTYPAAAQGEDAILTRILALHGLEPHNANTRSRYIYIHGTNDTDLLGTPASHGCVRLAPQDMRTLFDRVRIGTRVQIRE